MSKADIYNRVRTILYGQGLGEKPAYRVGAANANASYSGQLITFSLDTDEGAKVKPGNVLSLYSPKNENFAFAIYVTSVSGDAVTGINAYLGSPEISNGATEDALDGAIFEQNPLVTGHTIFESIDTLIAAHLWPEVYKIETLTVATPDLIDGQEAVDADVREILTAWQRIGPTNYSVAFQRTPYDVDTSLASTGRMAEFDWIDGSTGYYTVKRKLTEADEADDELTQIMAQGTAAICLGSALAETTIGVTKKDNAEASGMRNQISSTLWREFLTSKQSYAEELNRKIPNRLVIDRG